MPKGDGGMTVAEAGKKGGDARKAQLREGGYSDLGQKGGSTTKARYGKAFYSQIGKAGWAARDPRRRHRLDAAETVTTANGERARDPRERHGGSR